MEEFVTLDLKSDFFDPAISDYGTDDDVVYKNVNVRIGQRPKVQNLKKLYELTNREIPPEWRLYEEYDIWLLTHTVGVINDQGEGNKRVKHLNYKTRFREDDGISIVDVMPKTQLVSRLQADLNIEADLNLNGKFELPKFTGDLTDAGFPVEGSGNAVGSAEANFVARLNLDLITPVITAIGEEDFVGQWLFTKNDTPLWGMQKMYQTILTPYGMEDEEIEFDAQVGVSVVSLFHFLPDKRKSDWVTIKCKLS